MEAEGRAVLRQAGVADAEIRFRRSAEMRYAGQGHEVEGAVPAGTLGAGTLEALTAGFESAYRALYHRTPDGRRHRGPELAPRGLGSRSQASGISALAGPT